MRWFELIMGEENQVENPFLAGEEDFLGIRTFDLKHGKYIENWNPNSWLRSDSPEHDGDPDDILGECLQLPTFSRSLQEALESCGVGMNDIQYLPVKVFKSTGEEIKGFAIANIITRVEALDREHCVMLTEDKSKIDPLTGKPRVKGIWRAALKGSSLNGHDIIRLLEFFPELLVSERFVEVFHEHKFTGATFSPVPVDGKGAPSEQQLEERGERSMEDHQAFYAKLFAPVEKRLGPLDPDTLVAIIGFDAGGLLNLRTVGRDRGEEFVTYISCELAGRGDQQKGELDGYEVMMTCNDEEWCRRVLTAIGRTTLENLLEHGHALDIGPAVKDKGGPIRGVVFDQFASVKIDGKKYGILNCHGVTQQELRFAMENGVEKSIGLLKKAGVYSRTDVNRKSIL